MPLSPRAGRLLCRPSYDAERIDLAISSSTRMARLGNSTATNSRHQFFCLLTLVIFAYTARQQHRLDRAPRRTPTTWRRAIGNVVTSDHGVIIFGFG